MDVPDGLLFGDEAAKGQANGFAEEWRRYELGLAVVESKRWLRPLDRRSGRAGEETAPSTQMLRYLRRIDDVTTGRLRWGILTDGARWRLYYQGARSVSEQFFEVDLAAFLDLPGHNDGLFALTEAERRHWLKVFALVFRREAFLPGAADARTFHQRAIEEGRFYEERVAANLSDLVFGQVFPELARAIAAAEPDAPLSEVREAALPASLHPLCRGSRSAAALDDSGLRRAWRDSGMTARLAGRALEGMTQAHATRPETARRLQEARTARSQIEAEAGRRGIDLAPRRRGRERGRGEEL